MGAAGGKGRARRPALEPTGSGPTFPLLGAPPPQRSATPEPGGSDQGLVERPAARLRHTLMFLSDCGAAASARRVDGKCLTNFSPVTGLSPRMSARFPLAWASRSALAAGVRVWRIDGRRQGRWKPPAPPRRWPRVYERSSLCAAFLASVTNGCAPFGQSGKFLNSRSLKFQGDIQRMCTGFYEYKPLDSIEVIRDGR